MPLIEALIDKVDALEAVRDQIAGVLAVEVASQKALAVTAGKDPLLWDLRVYIERADPWNMFLSAPDPVTARAETTPLVHVSYDRSDFDEEGSDLVERQKSASVFFIDVYGYGVAQDVSSGGHRPADKMAREERDRAMRLVRNILMSANYFDLGMSGFVYARWTVSIEAFHLRDDNDRSSPIAHIGASRLTLRVVHEEVSPQVAGRVFEMASIVVTRPDGRVLLRMIEGTPPQVVNDDGDDLVSDAGDNVGEGG